MIETFHEKHKDTLIGDRHKSALRVAILALPETGGVGYYSALLANALNQHVQVMVIVSEAMCRFPFDSRLEVVSVRKNKILSVPNPVSYRRIFGALKNFNPDVVHDTAGNACRWTFGLWPFIARRWPLVITEHDPRPHLGMETRLQMLTRKLAWCWASQLIVHGNACRQILVDAGIEPARVACTRHGIFDIYDAGKYASIAEEKAVLFFGKLRPNKGIHRLAVIAEQVVAACPEAKFIVAGGTNTAKEIDRAPVLATLERLQQMPMFEIHHRYIDDGEVEKFFRRAAVVILPYEEASQSGVIPIAYAFGKPVVAFDEGDLRESIVNGQTGKLVLKKDNAAFAAEVADLLVDQRRRKEMGRRAANWAKRELSWNSIAQKTVDIYCQVLARTSQKE